MKEIIKGETGYQSCYSYSCRDIALKGNSDLNFSNIVYNSDYKMLHPNRGGGQTGTIDYTFQITDKFEYLFLKYTTLFQGNRVRFFLKEEEKPFQLITEKFANNTHVIDRFLIKGFTKGKKFVIRMELYVETQIPWDSRIEAIRLYSKDHDTKEIASFTINH